MSAKIRRGVQLTATNVRGVQTRSDIHTVPRAAKVLSLASISYLGALPKQHWSEGTTIAFDESNTRNRNLA